MLAMIMPDPATAPDIHADRVRLLARELWRAQRDRQFPVQYARHQFEALVLRLGVPETVAGMPALLDKLAQGRDLQTIVTSL